MSYTQEGRLFKLNTPLGEDVLLLTDIKGEEGISTLFSFKLSMLSENPSIKFEEIIGENVTISIALEDDKTRYINGIVSEFSQSRGGEQGTADILLSYYTATIVPRLWLLTRTTNCRIFQNKTVPEIVESIFREKEIRDFSMNLMANYIKREYCVQYRESDFDFISRLLEDEGIYYFFQHEDDKHTLILTDDPSHHQPCPEQETARCRPHEGGVYEEDMIDTLVIKKEIRAGKYTLKDYNFEKPNTDLKTEVPSSLTVGPGEREYYDYPGGYGNMLDGDNLVNIRMQEEEARIMTLHGASNCRAFTCGYKFRLEEFYRDDMNNAEYVMTGIRHEGSQSYPTGDAQDEQSYINEFTCIPIDVPFRPQRVTRKPRIEGVQTAIVVGPSGEEIYPDKYGRVKVKFHWDRDEQRDESSSCWVRVSQIWAGAGWGAMFIPRIGHEVIVDFLEGDPDRPIITGRVYHGNNNPPYSLPGEKTKSTIKTNSSLGGGGFNEFRFEDKKGNEEIYLQGEKDWNILIKNDKSQTIGHDETLNVGNNRTKTVGVDQSESIGANKSITVGANHTESIGANMSLTVGSNKIETVAIASAESIGAAKALTIGAAYQVTVGAAMNETVGGAKMAEVGAYAAEKVGGNKTESIGGKKEFSTGKDYSIAVGKNMGVAVKEKGSISVEKDFEIGTEKVLTIKAKESILIQSDKEITLKSGSAQIILKKNGDIEIKGNKINVKGSGDVKIKGSKVGIN